MLALGVILDQLAYLLYQVVPAVITLDTPAHAGLSRVSPEVPEYARVLLLKLKL